jgi:hypothetical protein
LLLASLLFLERLTDELLGQNAVVRLQIRMRRSQQLYLKEQAVMSKRTTHTLYVSRATDAEVERFLTASRHVLFDCDWVRQAPSTAPQTHNVYCNLRDMDLKEARAELEKIATQMSADSEWQLMPDRI